MGQKFTKDEYKKIRERPEHMLELGLETINNQLFSFMLNDPEDYSRLHKTLQQYGNMSPDRLILSSRGKISLVPLLNSVSCDETRIGLLARIAEYGYLRQEYYVRWPSELFVVICKFIQGFRSSFDFEEQLKCRFNFDMFCHNNVIGICKKVRFANEYINRPEDIFLEFLGPKIRGMFIFLRSHYPENIPNYIIFKMIEGFYESSTRLAPTLNGSRVSLVLQNYPEVPEIPDEYLEEIILGLIEDRKISREDAKKFLRIPECPEQNLIDLTDPSKN